jgi:lipooligosaccharide transport system permease protein
MSDSHRPAISFAASVQVARLRQRIGAVWFRHMRVYVRNLFSNALPPFIEPIIFLAGIGLGLGANIGPMGGLPYIRFLALGLLVTAAMFTASFEMSYGTYIRLTFEKVYDGMLGAPLTALDLMVGEILWCGTKGAVFTLSVLVVCLISGALPFGWVIVSPLVGFLAGLMFAVLALMVTTLVSNINNFNFFFSGLLSPMFFFSGVVFPISNLPSWLIPVAELMPLTHPVRLVRGISGGLELVHIWDIAYILLFTGLIGLWAVRRMIKRLVE